MLTAEEDVKYIATGCTDLVIGYGADSSLLKGVCS
jgi:hypothetical protein